MKLSDLFETPNDDNELYNRGGLSPAEMDEIQKLIRRGAKNVDVEWTSALELLNKAYEETSRNIPQPTDRYEWDQYLENATYAVKMLEKYKGLDAKWRLTMPTE